MLMTEVHSPCSNTVYSDDYGETGSGGGVYINNGTFTINVRGEFTYKLFNSIGQQVMSGQGRDQTRIDASGLDRGVYFLQLTVDGTQTEKVVIEK